MTGFTWNVDADGDWGTAADWTPSGPPTSGATVTIDTTDVHTVTYSSSDGTSSVAGLSVGNDVFALTGGSLTVTAAASFGNTLLVQGGTLQLGALAVTAAAFEQAGGTIDGSGTLTVSGAATLAGSGGFDVQTGTGTTVLAGTTTMSGPSPGGDIALDGGRVLENKGTFDWVTNGSFRLGYNPSGTSVGGATIKNDSGATFNIQSDNHVERGSGATSFINAGTLVKTATVGSPTTGTTYFAVAFTNTGIVTISAGTIQFDGANSFSGTLDGAGAAILNGSNTLADLVVGGTVAVDNYVTTEQTAQVTIGDAAGGATFVNAVGGTYDIANDSGVGVGTGAGSQFINRGTMAKTGGYGVSLVMVDFASTGTLSVASGNLRFDGASNSFSGTYIGPGMVDYGAHGVATLSTISMISDACSTNFGTVNETGVVTISDGTTITSVVGASWNFTGDNGLALATGASSPLFTNHGTLAKTGGTGTTTVAIDVVDDGTVTAASGTLAFTGPSNSFADAIGGAGKVSFGGGSTTLNSGTTLGVAALGVSGSGTSVSVATTLSYAGTFDVAAGSTVNIGGGATFTLSGTVTFGGAVTLTGSGTSRVGLKVGGAAGGTGTVALKGSATAEFGGSAGGQTVSFTGTGNVLTLDAPGSFGGTITGFAAGDTLDLANETVTALSFAGATLTVTLSGGGTQTFNLSGAFDGLKACGDGQGDTDIVALASPATLTVGNEVVLLSSGTNVVNATSTTLTVGDNLIAAGGTNTLALSGGGAFALGNVTGFRTVTLAAGANYGLTTTDATVAAGATLTVGAGALAAGNALTFNGAAETSGAFAVTGGAGADRITAGAGNDTLSGGAGADSMSGGAGNDLYIVDNAGDVVNEAAGGGTDRVATSVGYALAANQSIEALAPVSYGSTTNINLTGNTLAQAITGNAGDNVLGDGGAGSPDTMAGLGGNDTYVVNNTGDAVSEAAGAGTDRVAASVSYSLATGQSIEALTPVSYGSTGDIVLTGNALAQAITGNAGNNGIGDGGAGGADTMSGLAGDDTYTVNNTGDVVSEAANGGADRVITNVSFTLGANQSIETLGPMSFNIASDISLTGNDLAQTIYGNAGANVVDGKGGNDVLYGKAGADTFVFDTTPDTLLNDDTIADFSVGSDIVALSHAIYAALAPGNLAPSAFVSGSAATNAAQHVIYDPGTGALLYDADGNGSGAAVQFAHLSPGLTTLAASCFKVT